MGTLIIKKGDKTRVSKNFTADEFYSKSSDAPASHSFPTELVEAVQFLRSHFDTPWRITSGVRTPAHELRLVNDYNRKQIAAGSKSRMSTALATTSQHVRRKAVDSQPTNKDPEVLAELQNDFLTRGPIFQELRRLGVRGFGVYDTFVHLDVRAEAGKQKDAHGTYAFWNNMANSPKKTSPTQKKPKVLASVS